MKNIFLILLLCLNPVFTETILGQNLRAKIGQMILVGFFGTENISDSLKSDLQNLNLGGVILHSRNLLYPSQIANLSAIINKTSQTPPFIAIDQEGGNISILNKSNGFDTSYTPYKVGTFYNNVDTTRNLSLRMSNWLKQSGHNLNLAPVVDINVNTDCPVIGKIERSFSKYPADVYKHSSIFINAFNSKNIITTLKHFPGHGSSLADSHLGFTDITNTWADSELIPYQFAIADGYKDFIMSGHLFNRNIDSTYPASLSRNILTNKLRNQMQFQGLTITDDLFMQSIVQNYTFDESIELAINAGNDVLLFSTNVYGDFSLCRTIIDLVMNKISQGRISQNTIEQSYQRIISIKKRYFILKDTDSNNHRESPGNAELFQNYPNPVYHKIDKPSSTIRYILYESTRVSLVVFNQIGEKLFILVDKEQSPGSYSLIFDTNNMASGIYFYQLRTNKTIITKKLVLLK